MTSGERIKNKRIELGMTQDELAKRCGYKSRSSINKLELSRDLSLKNVRKIADALGCDVSYLVGWDEPEETGELAADLITDTELLPYIEKLHNASEEDRRAIFLLIDKILGV